MGVIADVSETLVTALTDALSVLVPAPAPKALLHDLQQAVSTNPATLAVFLYEVNEDASTRNRPMVRRTTMAGAELSKPPLTLLLKYLLVPFAGDVQTEQRMLGRTMQALYEHPIFSGPDLRGAAAPAGLVGSAEILATTLDPLTLDERSRIWHAIQRPYRLSLSYQLRVANVEPENRQAAQLVRSRNFDPAVPVNA